MISRPGKQTITIHMLTLNISRRRGNQRMEFGQLIEYNTRNIFLEKSYTTLGGETIPRPFCKNQNWARLSINSLKFIRFVFVLCQVEGYRNILKLNCKPLAFTSNNDFLKNKKRSETSRPASLSAFFLKKNNSHAMFINWPNFIIGLHVILKLTLSF